MKRFFKREVKGKDKVRVLIFDGGFKFFLLLYFILIFSI